MIFVIKSISNDLYRGYMHFLIYLDQNILSDLRQRKIEETKNEHFAILKNIIKSEYTTLIYSYITFEEILQIPNIKYQKEHIDLLTELDAIYLDYLPGRLINLNPHNMWNNFLEDMHIKDEFGISQLMATSQLISRKISGLPVKENFMELHKKVKIDLFSSISYCENILNSIDLSHYGELGKTYKIFMLNQINQLKEKSQTFKPQKISNEQQLGPQAFRAIPKLKALEIKNMEANSVVNKIDELFKQENNNSTLEQYFEKTPLNDIVRAYNLMNWAGYYPDDFTKTKKNKDRFNASNKDMMHAVIASSCDFLISNDVNFCKKAIACYAYSGIKTVVCNLNDFIKEHAIKIKNNFQSNTY